MIGVQEALNKAVEDNRKLEKEIERLNNIIENLTTMTVNGDRTQIKNTAQHKIDRAIEYMEEAINSDSFTELPSGKITDIPYCIVAFEDLLEILKGK